MIINNADRQIKIKLFLYSLFLFLAINMVKMFFGSDIITSDSPETAFLSDSRAGQIVRIASHLMLASFWGVCFILTISTAKRKAFRGRAVKILAAGVTAWLLWGVASSFTGIARFSNIDTYKEIIIMFLFSSTMLMASRIIIFYGLEEKVIALSAFCMGTTLLIAFLTHIDGLRGIADFVNIFSVSERSRYTFGLSGPNYVGRLCFHFFILSAMYGTYVVLRDGGGGYRNISRLSLQ